MRACEFSYLVEPNVQDSEGEINQKAHSVQRRVPIPTLKKDYAVQIQN